MFNIRTIQMTDNQHIANIIRNVSIEFGLAAESGYAVADSTLDQLSFVYAASHSCYWVVTNENNQVLGGGGIAPLQGDDTVLEIQKMYFTEKVRGFGFAKQILQLCFEFARAQGFSRIYLETTASLWQAVKLYEKLGFIHLSEPMGNTGHSKACEIRMLKHL